MSADTTRIGARLRSERKARRMTVDALAEAFRDHASGRDRHRLPKLQDLRRMIRGYEACEHVPGPRYRMLYAAVFSIDEEILFADERDVSAVLWRVPGADLNRWVTPDDEERLTLATHRPSRVDAGTVGALSAILAGQRRLEDAIGPAALLEPVTAQTHGITGVLREASGRHRDELGRVVSEWATFAGWLHAATRQDGRALALFDLAEDLADDVDYGTGAALATSFRGYVARQQGRPRAVIRAASAALATSGVHQTQKTFDTLQAAQGYAAIGEREQVRRMLDDAADLAQDAGEPPAAVYWYTEPFFRLNIGLVQAGIGEYGDAADMLGEGLDGMPADQRGADWVREYEQALTEAKDRA
jgi:transcriptional regulator with XRE-family HTH domain